MVYLAKYGLVPHDCSTVAVGQRFERIVILAVGKIAGTYRYKAVYRCDCGNERCVQIGSIQIGQTQSCGCKSADRSRTHGLWDSPIYRTWQHIISRCHNSRSERYKDYGGRGITVCARWQDVSKFHEDMLATYKPGLTIDRIDNNSGYSPENCRWATREIQQRNRRNNIWVEMEGQLLVLKDWCTKLDIPYSMVYHRVTKMGWTPERAISTPSRTARLG